MKTLGLDIGTTTISAVVLDTSEGVIASRTVKNDTFLSGEPWEKLQDPVQIYDRALSSVTALVQAHPDIAAIGLTGQMHGIVYVDAAGNAVSPLYTWQDGRGDLPCSAGESWAQRLSRLSGYALATGYGMVTHYHHLNHQQVPDKAVTFCTIHDYVAMRLAGRTSPAVDPTDAASFGLYDAARGCFDHEALQAAGIGGTILPPLMETPYLGTGPLGIPVYAGIGDNQASFLGAAEGRTDVLLINVGTGSQISIYSPVALQTETLETRPFPDGGWLLVGASLCGGRSYALLENFFQETVRMVTGSSHSAYEGMARLLTQQPCPEDLPTICTTFQGTRKDPTRKGSIEGLDIHNFTPVHLIHGFMHGMADELFAMYRGYLQKGGQAPASIVGSGNGLRKNPHLCQTFEATFGCPLTLSNNEEEAACGAARYAARHCS